MEGKLLSSVIYVQYIFRKKVLLRNKLNSEYTKLYYYIFNLMKKLNGGINSNIMDYEVYGNLMEKLDKILNKYVSIENETKKKKLFELNYEILSSIKKKLSKLKIELISIFKYTGYDSINSSLQFILGSSFKLPKNAAFTLELYNKIYSPISVHKYNICNNKIDIDKNYLCDNGKQENIFNPLSVNSLNNINVIHKYKLLIDNDVNFIKENMLNCDENNYIVCSNIKTNSQTSIHELIRGSRVYILCNNNKNVIVFNGYFTEDPLNIMRNSKHCEKKTQNLKNNLELLPINSYFKEGYLKQITLKDFIINTELELEKKCLEAFNKLNSLKSKTISSLVKDFLSSNIDEQREYLTLFLLSENDSDTQYLAYLMYDMISNESYLLKPQPLAEQVFNSLHWSIQKLFKIAISNSSQYSKNIINFNEEDMSYEKRICLMKAPQNVKAKAMEKYKEISSKQTDGSSKAQQYLDGILRIPFGIYKKEEILTFLDDFRSKLSLANSNDKISYSEIDKLILSYESQSDYLQNMINNQVTSKAKCCKIIAAIKKILNVKKIEYIEDNEPVSIVTSKSDLHLLNNFLFKFLNYFYKCNENNVHKNEIGKLLKDNNIEYNTYNDNSKINLNILSQIRGEWDNFKINSKDYIINAKKILDNAVHGHSEAKTQIERIIAQWINGEQTGYCFGFEGPPGTGKTSLAKKGLTKCLTDKNGNSRPFSFIAVGGSSNGATLEGHSYTYVGSTWGKIVDILMETKCMNPIIFIDELDKISHTEHGKEIIGILTHLTDSTQNDEFQDKYFSGVKIDLSKVLIVFSYNDPELIDSILLDRIHRIKFKPLKKEDKLQIASNYMLPELLNIVGFSKQDLIIDNSILTYIIDNYTCEAGVRKLRERLFEIIREINLRYIMKSKICDKDIVLPYKVNLDFITKDIFSDRPKIQIKKISDYPRIGLVNGLYATAYGIGGLTIIESFKMPSEQKLALELTGQQGDVMKESMKVAKTVAWNILPENIKSGISKKWSDDGPFGIHIHCPEGATPKDGPSAGGAITTTIISLLTGIPVNNKVAMTGEIDLNGSIHAIGGLDAKLNGAKKAGITKALVPKQNEQDLINIKKEDKKLIDKNFEVVLVDNIWTILEHALTDNSVNFVNYTKPN